MEVWQLRPFRDKPNQLQKNFRLFYIIISRLTVAITQTDDFRLKGFWLNWPPVQISFTAHSPSDRTPAFPLDAWSVGRMQNHGSSYHFLGSHRSSHLRKRGPVALSWCFLEDFHQFHQSKPFQLTSEASKNIQTTHQKTKLQEVIEGFWKIRVACSVWACGKKSWS